MAAEIGMNAAVTMTVFDNGRSFSVVHRTLPYPTQLQLRKLFETYLTCRNDMREGKPYCGGRITSVALLIGDYSGKAEEG